jgi:hypothetical protein
MLYLTKTQLGSSQFARNSAATHSHLVHVKIKKKNRAYVLNPRFRIAPLYWGAGSDMEIFRMTENGLRKTQGACGRKQTVQPVQGEPYNCRLLISTDFGNGASQVPSIVRLPIRLNLRLSSRTIALISTAVECVQQLSCLESFNLRCMHSEYVYSTGSYLSTVDTSE